MNVGIINYGVCNLGSVYRALMNLGVNPVLIKNPKEIYNFDSIILLSGNFKKCKLLLDDFGWSSQIQGQFCRSILNLFRCTYLQIMLKV